MPKTKYPRMTRMWKYGEDTFFKVNRGYGCYTWFKLTPNGKMYEIFYIKKKGQFVERIKGTATEEMKTFCLEYLATMHPNFKRITDVSSKITLNKGEEK